MRRFALLVSVCAALVTCRTPTEPAEARDAGDRPATVTFVTPSGQSHVVRVEVARTVEETSRGLMFREELAAGEGMLFIFERELDRGFWMKNTLIPLDMIFVNRDRKVVGVVHEAAPLTETSRRVGRPSLYVVEVPGGWARAHGIDAGTEVRFSGVEGL